MSDNRIKPIVMPKWGLSMKEGKVTGWLAEEGTRIDVGKEILEVETDKIAGVVEAADSGVLRRRVGTPDTVYPVKALLGVVADENVSDAEIDAYVAGYVTPAVEEGEEEAGPGHEFLDLPEGRIRYVRRGSGPQNVILIHGFGGDLDNWLFNIDALAEGATVYALDLPGHGQSSKTLADPTTAGLAKTLLAFADALGIDRAHLVGHSLGGAIAIEAARQSAGNGGGGKVSSVSLIAPAGLGAEINDDYIRGFVGAASRRDLKPVVENLFADPGKVTRQLVDDLLKYKRLDGVDAALAALAAGSFKDGRQQVLLADALGKLGIPVLVVWGSEDKIIPAAHAGNAKGAKVEVIAGAGHMVQMEAAAKVNALLKEHLGRA
jgi:pyruvate dehydrogenase E2 component (dihydrolipoamide acetyltransferase)